MNSKIVKIVVAVVLLAAAAFFAMKNSGVQFSAPPGDQLYFYDVAGHKIVALPDAIPPVNAGGSEAVRVYVYTCGEACTDTEKLIPLYFEKWTSEAAASMAKVQVKQYADFGADLFLEGRQASANADGPWIDWNSKEAAKFKTTYKCPAGTKPQSCSGPKG